MKTKVLTRAEYERELERLQVELVRLQEWILQEELKIVVLFEGRDTAGKGGVIRRIGERTNPRVVRTVALGMPRPQLVQPRRGRAGDGLLQRHQGVPLVRGRGRRQAHRRLTSFHTCSTRSPTRRSITTRSSCRPAGSEPTSAHPRRSNQ
jgi:hypothetical protein